MYSALKYFLALTFVFTAGVSAASPTRSADVVIYGATPGGVACAVRSAREGLSVILISYNDRIGGMLTSGLGVWDTLYEGHRAPLYNELRQTIFDYYRDTYGEDSDVYRDALPGKSDHSNGTFEAHVAEKLVNAMVAAEPNITVIYNHYPHSVTKKKGILESLTLHSMDTDSMITVTGTHFADCSYEGDLMAVANVSYRVGREAQHEYDETHAGVIYMMPEGKRLEPDSRQSRTFDRLNIRHFGGDQTIIYPDSTHEADTNVQAYNMRYYVTDDPDNQIELSPSDEYDPESFASLEFHFPPDALKPRGKLGLNRPQLLDLHQTYVEGDWPTRRHVIAEHIRMTRDMVYYVTQDPDAPTHLRERAQGWGIAADEWTDNNNNPYEIYVREARRLVGRYVFSENDLSLQGDYERTKIHADSIGIIEWYMDSHASTSRNSDQGGLHEGKMMLHKKTFVGQLPYRSIVTQELDNLLVPVPMSATHVAWGAVRLEPTWMQIGESAAFAILQARQEGVALTDIDTNSLLRRLATERSLISFFNDFYIDEDASWVPAIQYFGTQGFFPSYDARPLAAVSTSTLAAWVKSLPDIAARTHDPESLARELSAAKPARSANYHAFRNLLAEAQISSDSPLLAREPGRHVTRAAACEILWAILDDQPPYPSSQN